MRGDGREDVLMAWVAWDVGVADLRGGGQEVEWFADGGGYRRVETAFGVGG